MGAIIDKIKGFFYNRLFKGILGKMDGVKMYAGAIGVMLVGLGHLLNNFAGGAITGMQDPDLVVPLYEFLAGLIVWGKAHKDEKLKAKIEALKDQIEKITGVKPTP